MSTVTGDPQHLKAAAAALKPVVGSLTGQSHSISSASGTAAGAAGHQNVVEAIEHCLGSLSKATGDTGLIISQLGQVAQLTAENLSKADGGGS